MSAVVAATKAGGGGGGGRWRSCRQVQLRRYAAELGGRQAATQQVQVCVAVRGTVRYEVRAWHAVRAGGGGVNVERQTAGNQAGSAVAGVPASRQHNAMQAAVFYVIIKRWGLWQHKYMKTRRHRPAALCPKFYAGTRSWCCRWCVWYNHAERWWQYIVRQAGR